MKKILITLFLFLVILATFSFVYLKASALGSEESYFNQNLRDDFSKSHTMRSIIGLHDDGDAKYDYLGAQADTIVIEIDSLKGLGASSEVMMRLAERIEELVQKDVIILNSEKNIPYQESMSFEELREIKDQYQTRQARNGEAVLYILFASTSDDNASRLGSTLEEDGLVFFQSNIMKLANKSNQENYENIIFGTLLHEFGHQLGLDHNTYQDCLMNGQDIYNTKLDDANITYDFCQKEIDIVKQNMSDI